MQKSSFNAIATEKVSSPTVIRNKHIKTMTSLLSNGDNEAQTQHQIHQEGLRQKSMGVVGRNSNSLSEHQRLFQRQNDSMHPQNQLLSDQQSPKSIEQHLGVNPLVFKTMSSVMLDDNKNRPQQLFKRQSEKTLKHHKSRESCTILISKSQPRKHEPVVAIYKNPNLAAEAGLDFNKNFSQTLAQKLVRDSDRVGTTPSCTQKKQRNNSMTGMVRYLSQCSREKSVQGQGCSKGLPPKNIFLKLEASPFHEVTEFQQNRDSSIKNQAAARQIGNTGERNQILQSDDTKLKEINTESKQSYSSTKAMERTKNLLQTPSATVESCQDSSNFSSAVQHMSNKHHTHREPSETYRQSTGNSRNGMQVPQTVRPVHTGSLKAKADRQSFNAKKGANFELTQNVAVLSNDSQVHKKNTQRTRLDQGLTQVKVSRLPSQQATIKAEDLTDSTAIQIVQTLYNSTASGQKLHSYLLKKEMLTEISASQTRSNAEQKSSTRKQPIARPSIFQGKKSQQLSKEQPSQKEKLQSGKLLEKRTISAADIAANTFRSGLYQLQSPHQASENMTHRVSLGATTPSQGRGLIISRNAKQVYASQHRPQVLPMSSTSVNLVGQDGSSSVSKFNAGNSATNVPLTTRSSAQGATVGMAGTKKEIKCVVTKQTKFNEERQQLQQTNTTLFGKKSPTQLTQVGLGQGQEINSIVMMTSTAAGTQELSYDLLKQHQNGVEPHVSKKNGKKSNQGGVMGLESSSKSQQSNYKTHYATLKSTIGAAKSGNAITSSSNVNATNNTNTANSSGTGAILGSTNKHGQPSIIMLPTTSATGKKSQKSLNKNNGYQTAQTTRSAHKNSHNGIHQNSSQHHISLAQGKAPGSADKNREKQYRRQIVQKIKNQLIQAFHTNGGQQSSSRLKQHDLAPKQKQATTIATASDSDVNQQLNYRQNMLKTFDDKLSSPILKSPSLFMVSTPTREPNPHRPQQKQQQQLQQSIGKTSNSAFRISAEGFSSAKQMNRSELKKQRQKLVAKPDQTQAVINLESNKLDLPSQRIKQKTSRTLQKKYESPTVRRSNEDDESDYESQLSAPQEISSQNSQISIDGSLVQSRPTNGGLQVPQSVQKITGLALNLSSVIQAQQSSRNFNGAEVRFSQRVQRTLPNLAAPDQVLGDSPKSQHRMIGGGQIGQGFLVDKYQTQCILSNEDSQRRRNTVFSDTHSLDLVRNSKPTFTKPMNKGGGCSRQPRKSEVMATHHQMNDNNNPFVNTSSLVKRDLSCSNQMSKDKPYLNNAVDTLATDMSVQRLETTDDGKHIPPIGLSEELQIKANLRNNLILHTGHMDKQKASMSLIGGRSSDNGMIQDYSKTETKQEMIMIVGQSDFKALPSGYDTDYNAMDERIEQIKSPPESVALEAIDHQMHTVRAFNPAPTYQFDKKQDKSIGLTEPEDLDTENNVSFSESQLGEIADEENYKGVIQGSSDLNSMLDKNTNNEDTILLPSGQRPIANLSGKYTTGTNKNDSLNFQPNSRLMTIRQMGTVSQTEQCAGVTGIVGGGIQLESAKQILSKKGSKCKCPISKDTAADSSHPCYQEIANSTRPAPCGSYCKNLTGHMQKKIVKKLLLENFKVTMENAIQSNQKLALSEIQNPFMLQANFGCLNDRKFLISASWWSKWCDYVNFNVDEHGLTFPKESFRDELLCDTNEQHDEVDGGDPFDKVEVQDMDLEDQQNQVNNILRLSIYQQSSFATLAEAIENDHEQSQLFYERPDMIQNANLQEQDMTSYRNQVNKTLVEHFDYEVLPHSVWQHFYSWYSADVTICRKLAIDNMKDGSNHHNQPGGAIGNTLTSSSSQSMAAHGQDSFRHTTPKYKVYLDLWPTAQTMYSLVMNPSVLVTQTQQQLLNQRIKGINQELMIDEVDDPQSNDTTQLLYKQQIEDHSSTIIQNSLLLNTPPDQSAFMMNKHQESSQNKLQQVNVVSSFSPTNHHNHLRGKSASNNKHNNNQDLNHQLFTGAKKSRQANLLNQMCRNTLGGTQTSMNMVTQNSSKLTKPKQQTKLMQKV